MNAKRMADSARRLVMPEFPEDKFIEAVKMVVEANKEWVPPFGSARRSTSAPTCSPPGVVIGVKPADEYQFRILVTPVGPYFKGDKEAITITVADFDRAAPRGTGDIKAGLNYAMSLHPYEEAHKTATPRTSTSTPQTRTYVEETGGANVLFVDKEGSLVVPPVVHELHPALHHPPLAGDGGERHSRHERYRAPREVRGGRKR